MKKILLLILFLSCFYSIVFGAASDYAGVYSGNIAGNDSGPWVGVVEPTGHAKMLFYSYIYHTMDGSQGYYVNSSGELTAVTTVNRAVFSVSFNIGGNVFGTWASPNFATGTISGLKQTNNSKYAGTYNGTISGEDFGSWTITIDSSGLISGSGSSQNTGLFNFDGAIDNTGFLMGVTEESSAYGSISGDSLSGSWFDDGVSYGGTFNGTKQNEAYNYYIPVFKSGPNSWSGLGITNLSTISTANIKVKVYSNIGAILTTENKTIAANGQDNFVSY